MGSKNYAVIMFGSYVQISQQKFYSNYINKLCQSYAWKLRKKTMQMRSKTVDLEEKIALQEKKIENLSIKCDDNEQIQ